MRLLECNFLSAAPQVEFLCIQRHLWWLEVQGQGPAGLVSDAPAIPGLQMAAFVLRPQMAFPLYMGREREFSGVSSS